MGKFDGLEGCRNGRGACAMRDLWGFDSDRGVGEVSPYLLGV